MALLLEQAHDEDAQDVAQFLASLNLSVPADRWERIFSSETPAAAKSRPLLVRLEDGPVHAFGAVRNIEIQVGEETVSGTVLHEFFVSDDDEYGWRAAAILLDEVCRGATLSIAAGVSLHASRIIESQRWLALGEFHRWRIDPEKRDKASPLPPARDSETSTTPQSAPAALIHVVRDPARAAWLHGTEGESFAVRDLQGNLVAFARRADAARRETREWHITDVLYDGTDPSVFFRNLGSAVRASGEPAYLSMFAPSLEVEVARSGWERHRSRWPVYTYFRSSRDRDLVTKLARGDGWFLTPMDVGLERF